MAAMKKCARLGYFLKIGIFILIWINEPSSVLSTPSKLPDNMRRMKAVKDRILNGYDKTIRPPNEYRPNRTEVHTSFVPRQILEVDEERRLFILDSYFYIVWNDSRLAWNSITEYDGNLQLPSDLLWKPDLSVHNSWELIVEDANFFRNERFYDDYNETYVSLDFTFPIKRRMPPEIEATRQPCILVMLLTLSIFWLPANSSKKVFLEGIVFLALTVLLVYVACSTKFPLGAVFAVSFLQSTIYTVVITHLFQILVISNLCNITGPVRPPPFAMQLLMGTFGRYTCLRSSSSDNFPIDRKQLKEHPPNVIESSTPNEDWMLFAAGLDRIFFILVSVAMLAVHH